MKTENKLLTVNEVAENLQISIRQVRNYTASGAIQIIRLGRSIRISQNALEDFLETNTTK